MIYNRFLSLGLFAFLFNVPSYSQFDLVKDFNGGAESSFGSFSKNGTMYSIGTKMIVQYDSVADGQNKRMNSLAVLDGAGNSQHLAFSTLYYDSNIPDPFFDFKTLPDGKVAFVVAESLTSYKVIITDGTAAGTTIAYSTATPITGLEMINSGLYFTYDGPQKQALMKIELTSLAVSEVVAFGSFYAISDISKVSNTSLIFMAADAADNDKIKLYVSDGTAIGTTALSVINSNSDVSENALLTQVGNKVYFFYKLPYVENVSFSDLWVTDGTVAGTQKLKQFNLLNHTLLSSDRMIFGWKDKFYFAGRETGSHTDQVLWVSDGTIAGTQLLMNSITETIHPKRFTVFNDALYFITVDGIHYDNELYKTDGTVGGTVHINIKFNEYKLLPSDLVAHENYLYMGAFPLSSPFGDELFRYDGIHTQCAMLEGHPGIPGGSEPTNLFVHGNDLYFTARLNATGKELYTLGGDFTPAVTTDTKSAAANAFTVYPNPATDQVSIKSSEKVKSLRLVNQFGNVLTETTDNTLRLDSYSEGIYFIEVQLMNGEIGFQKIVLVK